MQNWYKNVFVDATVLFELSYMQIWTICRTIVTQGSIQVRLRSPWATEQTYRLLKPTDMKLDMSDANVQKHRFSNLPAY